MKNVIAAICSALVVAGCAGGSESVSGSSQASQDRRQAVLAAVTDVCIGNLGNFTAGADSLRAQGFRAVQSDGRLTLYTRNGDDAFVLFTNPGASGNQRCGVSSNGLSVSEATELAREAARTATIDRWEEKDSALEAGFILDRPEGIAFVGVTPRRTIQSFNGALILVGFADE